jgi:hypothetical protein
MSPDGVAGIIFASLAIAGFLLFRVAHHGREFWGASKLPRSQV